MAVLNKTIKGLAFAVLAVAALTGCRIDAPTYPFKIKVVNADGIPIQSCVVTATVDVANHRDEADFEGTTSFSGVVEFEYDYEAVFKITAMRGGNPPTYIGCGFVKLEPDQMVEKTITILPYDPTDPGC